MSAPTPANRAGDFIRLYNELDAHLRAATGLESVASFSAVLNAAMERNPAIRRWRDTLREYAELRNAIIHDRSYPARIIAEPSEEAHSEFKRIVEGIISPRKVIPAFMREVRTFRHADLLVEALHYMREQDFSQVVVSEAGKLALLTSEGVARWLGARSAEDIISVREASVGDVLAEERGGTHLLMDRDSTVDEAEEAFSRAIERGRPRIYAILLTEHGRESERLLGIITPWDLLD